MTLVSHNLHDSLFATICFRPYITRSAALNKLKNQYSVEFTFGGRGAEGVFPLNRCFERVHSAVRVPHGTTRIPPDRFSWRGFIKM